LKNELNPETIIRHKVMNSHLRTLFTISLMTTGFVGLSADAMVARSLSGRYNSVEAGEALDTLKQKKKQIENDSIQSQKTDSVDAKALPDLHVEADSHLFTPGKSVYTPSKRDKNIATDALSLLRHMSIPQLIMQQGSIASASGAPITYFINGIEATSEDLTGMLVRNVRKVEYLEYPSDPKFHGAPCVVNFIVQEYLFGGYTKLSSGGQVIGIADFYETLFSKFTYGRMTYDLSFSPRNYSINHGGMESEEIYHPGTEDEVIRKTIPLTSRYRYNNYPVKFRAVYRKGSTSISNLFGFSQNGNGKEEYSGRVIFGDEPPMDYFNSAPPAKTTSFSWQSNNSFYFGKGWGLWVNPYYNYSRYKTNNLYENSGGADIVTNVHENSHQGGISMTLSKYTDRHNFSFFVNGNILSSKAGYSGNSSFSNSIKTTDFGMNMSYTYKYDKIYLSANAGISREHNDINGKTNTRLAPDGQISFNYVVNSKNTISINTTCYTSSPSAAQKNPTPVQLNEMMYVSGDPDIGTFPILYSNASYTWIPNNKFNLRGQVGYNGSFDRIHSTYHSIPDSRAVMRTYSNSGDCHTFTFFISANLKLFNDRLRIQAAPSYWIYRASESYIPDFNSQSFYIYALYYIGNFYIQANYNWTNKYIPDVNTMERISRPVPNNYSLSAGWGNGKVNASMTLGNFFRKSWKSGESWVLSPAYRSSDISFGTGCRQLLTFSLSYSFDYGKKIQHGNEISGDVGGASSTILR